MRTVAVPKRCAEQPTLLSVHGLRGPSVLRQPAHGLRSSQGAVHHRRSGLSVLRRPAHRRLRFTRFLPPLCRRSFSVGALPSKAFASHELSNLSQCSEPATLVPSFIEEQIRFVGIAAGFSVSACAGARAVVVAKQVTWESVVSRYVARCRNQVKNTSLMNPRPNHSIERTCSSGLRPLPHAAHVKR
jgi:hypothetical protein